MNPVLPSLSVHLWGQHLGWALVLAALVGWCLPPIWTSVRRPAMVLVALVALIPGPYGPVYWLALAYPMPSLASIALALWWLRGEMLNQHTHLPTALWGGLATLGSALLMDTLALLPWPLYAWGFGPHALTVVLLIAVLLCLRPAWRSGAWVVVLIGAVFAVTRLPTGNVWDALCDPWLGVLALGVLVRRRVKSEMRPSGQHLKPVAVDNR